MRYLFFVARSFAPQSTGELHDVTDPTSADLRYQCFGSYDFEFVDPEQCAKLYMESTVQMPQNGFLMLVPAEDLSGIWSLPDNQDKTRCAVAGPYFFRFEKRSMYDIQPVD